MAGVAGRSGRKPKPAEKKLAAGNPGKRAINKDTPSYGEITNVFAPEWLQGHGRDLWEHLAPLLCREKILQATDIQNLEAYCAAYGRFRSAEEEIQKHGIVVEGAQGGPLKNPAATVANEALKQMATYGSFLGLDPSSRQRMQGPKKPGKGNPFAALLGGGSRMAAPQYPRVAQALKFAKDVVKGKVPACRYVVLACQRHLDDLAASKSAKYPYRFNAAEAEKKLTLIELMPHTKGEWAFKRQLVTLEPWQKFGLAVTFGWVKKKGGLRRFRESYWEVPRKNGKSVIAAGVGISMFVADDEFGAEIYSGATTEKQAWEVFRPARLMVQRSPMLVEHMGIEVNAQALARPEDGSRFEPIIGNPGDGASPSCSIVDEYHEHDSAALYETMLTGMGARNEVQEGAVERLES